MTSDIISGDFGIQPEPAALFVAKSSDPIAIGPAGQSHEDRLIHARLGYGSSLFTALRYKDAGTAEHSLRVALGCSSWGLAVGMKSPLLDELEIAALLHDIGKIGVPDHLLKKPEKLTDEEVALVRNFRTMGLAILKSFGASQSVLSIVRCGSVWYRCVETTSAPQGEELPMGARMLAIMDAFDAMTSHRAHHPARTRQQAMSELQRGAGTQFDPALVEIFCEMQDQRQEELHSLVSKRWLCDLSDQQSLIQQSWCAPGSPTAAVAPLFLDKLLNNMRDGVIFVDRCLHIKLWNRGAKRLTGIDGAEALEQIWSPELVGLRDEKGRALSESECPVREVVETSMQSMRRLQLTDNEGRTMAINMHVVPVNGPDGGTHGANILMHDVTFEADLEERVQTLHHKATRDPLTQVANRAEFDRTHQSFIDRHSARDLPCSLIICDIDHFKKINDTYGHQAGDEALIVFAKMLGENCRPGDLVARYGGEEFVILCADCDLKSAETRAQQLRKRVECTPLESLRGKRITASFGVTETVPHDTDESMLRRADHALLSAKENGRNCVVAHETRVPSADEGAATGWFSWWKPVVSAPVLQRSLITPVPVSVAVEQLRGFIDDLQARVQTIDSRTILLRIEAERTLLLRRESDRPVAFLIELTFNEEQIVSSERDPSANLGQSRTKIEVTIRPRRNRDRRRTDTIERAQLLYNKLQSFLMANDAAFADQHVEVVQKHTTLTGTWLESS